MTLISFDQKAAEDTNGNVWRLLRLYPLLEKVIRYVRQYSSRCVERHIEKRFLR
jgi:hypothetical protein